MNKSLYLSIDMDLSIDKQLVTREQQVQKKTIEGSTSIIWTTANRTVEYRRFLIFLISAIRGIFVRIKKEIMKFWIYKSLDSTYVSIGIFIHNDCKVETTRFFDFHIKYIHLRIIIHISYFSIIFYQFSSIRN